MFAGLMGLECHNNSLRNRCEVTEGGRASGTAGSSGRKRFHRRPGYMRGEHSRLPRLQCSAHGQREEEEEEEEEEEDKDKEKSTTLIRNGKSGRRAGLPDQGSAQRLSLTPAVEVSLMNQPTWSSLRSRSSPCSVTHPHTSSHAAESTQSQSKLRLSCGPAPESSQEDTFNSSFSFIQQSLSSSQRTSTTTTPVHKPKPLNQSPKAPNLPETKSDTFSTEHISSKNTSPPKPLLLSTPGGPVEREEQSAEGRFWRECLWVCKDEASRSLDIEATSSLSVDSDTASASSVTSGYESATPASEQGWDNLVKKYEGVLQDCLQNNRTHTKIESMMLKLQRLQQKAILDDDYDAAERFGKKLEELCRERDALKLGLPSRQPSVALFLERLRQVVHSALQRTDRSQPREGAEPDTEERADSTQGPLQRRNRLIEEKRKVEREIAELQQRLAELKDCSRCLEHQIQQEEQQVEAEELEGSVLRTSSLAQLRDMSRTLQDLITSENRTQISVSPRPSMLRLQEQEQALNLSIKEATAKVVMSQRLGSSLRRKVSETETQLLALHEAKLAAISGNDFSSAKELKAEMKAVYLERDRLEALAKRLHSLSTGSSQELARMKEQRQQLRRELEQREAQHESRLKENTTKYMELLEDRLHSCGCQGLERIWEADLEACHLFLRGLQLRTPSCGGADVEDLPSAAAHPPIQTCTKEEEDCAMLTALGGRWCPEANLQNSEFTKKLEEFLFCMEENHPESLEKEVQEVKSTLQTMLAQLQMQEGEEEEQEEEEEGEEEEGEEGEDVEEEVNELNDSIQNGTEEVEEDEEEEEEEEEDQYFSDSWDI
ncbi:unnamed protein product [Menidia menidia]|uniref:(Atlantic silverside) hypothetical protein n=1 Tax=Menidia menidia TaxID=238744 RepID=A0A8S4BNS1_9TELE|nr:unnamed protein product [Menidia menidia]